MTSIGVITLPEVTAGRSSAIDLLCDPYVPMSRPEDPVVTLNGHSVRIPAAGSVRVVVPAGPVVITEERPSDLLGPSNRLEFALAPGQEVRIVYRDSQLDLATPTMTVEGLGIGNGVIVKKRNTALIISAVMLGWAALLALIMILVIVKPLRGGW
ncbi:hypothetical protein E4J66_03970 [Actinomyces viscosus]|uniref:Uncharacterized protein n=1 Tax=Actinomyces viscosus TaxID=1656 RepID=A0A3S4Z3D3_ACTVI|nr:hypothetical protein [Actinomyces viscosus]TFH53279.1 hypothetical protein E4J66_03970 [Actinomyces viscosus]VEI18130.1 Uncharacterised protein [Actinomyces viscosus]